MKQKILLAIFTLICVFSAERVFAQIYNYGDDCFYAKAGSSECSYVVKFEGSKGRAWLKSVSHSTVRTNLSKEKRFYENEIWKNGENSVSLYLYDSSKSTSSRAVYKKKKTESNYIYPYYNGYFWVNAHWETKDLGWDYVAFSKDKESFIKWFEPLNNYNGEIKNKMEYSRIPKENLLPKSANYDFLQ